MPSSDLRPVSGHARVELIRIAFHLLGTREAAEDVAQEALLRHHERFGVVRPATPPDSSRAWLVRVTRNLAIDRLRRARLERDPGLADRLLALVDAPDEPDDALARHERRRDAIRRLLDVAGPCDVAAVLLREVFGTAYARIADGSGRSEVAWRQAVRRALSRARDRASDDGFDGHTSRAHVEAVRPETVADGVLDRFDHALIERDAAPLFEALRIDAVLGVPEADHRDGAPEPVSVGHAFRGRISWVRLDTHAGRVHLSLVLDGRLLCRLPARSSAATSRV